MTTHPEWCRQDHACTAQWSSGGEHQSWPLTVQVGHHRLLATMTQRPGHQPVMEVRANVRLDPDPAASALHAAQVLNALGRTMARVAPKRADPGPRKSNPGGPTRRPLQITRAGDT